MTSTGESPFHTLLALAHDGDRKALARLLTLVENSRIRDAAFWEAVERFRRHVPVIGITGAPGVGKSSLVNQMIRCYRAQGRKVGVIACDPSSAFTGGALLGDRIRMNEHATDAGVFIRSLALRKALGGLSAATARSAALLDAAGCDLILVETVGVGQAEIDVVHVAPVVGLVLAPGLGDEVQSLKAGIMEIADVFIINKKDQPGADSVQRLIEATVALNEEAEGLQPVVVQTQSLSGEGVEALCALFEQRWAAMNAGTYVHQWKAASTRHAVEAELRGALDEALTALVPVETLVESMLPSFGLAKQLSEGLHLLQHFLDGPTVFGIDHLGVAVADLAVAKQVLEHAFGLECAHEEYVESDKVATATFHLDHVNIELLHATEGPIGKYLEKRGPGIHHICLRVQGLEGLMARFQAMGMQLLDAVPRQGAYGRRVAFLHPKSTAGILFEMAEVERGSL